MGYRTVETPTGVELVFFLVCTIESIISTTHKQKRGSENKAICDYDYHDIHGLYLSLGHQYKLEPC